MFFQQKIKFNCKESLAKFLSNHYRYDTMNSWNNASSYANCVKINRLGLRGSSLEKAWDILGSNNYWDEIRWPIQNFQDEWCNGYSIVSNGRNSGYLVLVEAEVYDPGYKSTCSRCGKLNYQAACDDSKCGVCGAKRVNLKKPLAWVRTKGNGIDQRMSFDDYMDMSHSWLKDRAELVRSFDAACDAVRDHFIELINDYMIVEETVMVPQTVKRLERV